MGHFERVNVSAEIFVEPHNGVAPVSLSEALRAGGIHYRVSGNDKTDVLRSAVELMPLPEKVDREFLLRSSWPASRWARPPSARESPCPTSAIRWSCTCLGPMVTLCFLENVRGI